MKKILLYILILFSATAFAQGIKVGGPFTKVAPTDNTITGYADQLNGGYHIVGTKTGLDSLLTQYSATRKNGMVGYVTGIDSTFRLISGAWVNIGAGNPTGQFIPKSAIVDSTTFSNRSIWAAWGNSFTEGFANGDTTYVVQLSAMSGKYIINNGIGGQTAQQIYIRFLAAPSQWKYPTIIEIGINNRTLPNAQDTIMKYVGLIVGKLATVGNTKYVISSIFNANTETIGNSTYNVVQAVNSAIAAAYPTHYANTLLAVRNSWVRGNSADSLAFINGITPPSKRRDNIHLNSAGNAVFANSIWQVMKPFLVDTNLVTERQYGQTFTAPPVIGGTTPNRAHFTSTKTNLLSVLNQLTIGTPSVKGLSRTYGAFVFGAGAGAGYSGSQTTSPILDVAWGGGPATIIYGAESNAETRADATNKSGRIASVPYTISQPLIASLNAFNSAAGGRLDMGGGTGVLQAITEGNLYAAATANTLTGTKIATWKTTGFGIFQGTPTSMLHVGSGTYSSSSAFSTSGFGMYFPATTYTSTSGTGGTVANVGVYTFGQPTLAPSVATTFSNASSVRIEGPPLTGPNGTITIGNALEVVSGQALFRGNVTTFGNHFLTNIRSATNNVNIQSNGGTAWARWFDATGNLFLGLTPVDDGVNKLQINGSTKTIGLTSTGNITSANTPVGATTDSLLTETAAGVISRTAPFKAQGDGLYVPILGMTSVAGKNFTSAIGFNTTAPTHSITLANTTTGYAHFNTSDQTTNTEVFRGFWNSNVYNLKIEAGGTATARNLNIATNNRSFLIVDDANSAGKLGFYRFTAGTSSPLTTGVGISGTWSASSGTNALMGTYSTINQSGTAGYIANHISIYEQARGTGGKFFAKWGTNGLAGGVGFDSTKFSVKNTGAIYSVLLGVNTILTANSDSEIASTTTGAGVLTALGIAVGSPGAFVTYNGAGGTPSSLVGTNITGTAPGLTSGLVTDGVYTTTLNGLGDARWLKLTGGNTYSGAQALTGTFLHTGGYSMYGGNQINVFSSTEIGNPSTTIDAGGFKSSLTHNGTNDYTAFQRGFISTDVGGLSRQIAIPFRAGTNPTMATTTGSLTSGALSKFDADGNLVAATAGTDYLPANNPTFTGTLTGPTANINDGTYGFNIRANTAGGVSYSIYPTSVTPNSTNYILNHAAGSSTSLNSPNNLYLEISGVSKLNVTSGGLIAEVPILLKGYIVAALPAAPGVGATAYVTDALAPSYLVAVVGGGTVKTPVFFDGTNWIAH